MCWKCICSWSYASVYMNKSFAEKKIKCNAQNLHKLMCIRRIHIILQFKQNSEVNFLSIIFLTCIYAFVNLMRTITIGEAVDCGGTLLKPKSGFKSTLIKISDNLFRAYNFWRRHNELHDTFIFSVIQIFARPWKEIFRSFEWFL